LLFLQPNLPPVSPPAGLRITALRNKVSSYNSPKKPPTTFPVDTHIYIFDPSINRSLVLLALSEIPEGVSAYELENKL